MKKFFTAVALTVVTAAFIAGCSSDKQTADDGSPAAPAGSTVTTQTDKTMEQASNETLAGLESTQGQAVGQTGNTAEQVPGSTQTSSYVTETMDDTVPIEERLDDPEFRAYLEKSRHEAWCSSFLVWIPEFCSGAFMGVTADDMFDRAMFSVVGGRESVLDYVDQLKDCGYTVDASFEVGDDTIFYSAVRDDGWRVELEYDCPGDVMRVSAGYVEPAGPEGDETDMLWSSSILMYVPVFTAGVLENHYDDDSDGRSSTAVFCDVSRDDAISYISLLKETGYLYDREEGEENGLIWYMASMSDGLFCEFQFSDGICRITVAEFE